MNIDESINLEPLQIELIFIPLFNLALQQNALPIIYELKVKNNSNDKLQAIECYFNSNIDAIIPKSIHIETIEPQEEIIIHDLGIELNYNILVSLSDSIKGKLLLDINNNNINILHKEYPIEAFAADQWLGLKIMPELLAAFVTPNMDVINHIQSLVAKELEKATNSSAIQGYQADKNRVYEICSAIYRAIHSLGINYSNPPSSFGTPGQRIRFADAIYKYRLGTCLDTTLLFASVMEQCNLHPVIILQTGHAYIGCHLVERYFSDTPMDDLQTIRKLVELDEFIVIETTMATSDATFAKAEAAARANHLNIDYAFQCAVDVVRSRYSGIRPLPLKRSAEGIELEELTHATKSLNYEHKRNLQTEIDLSSLESITSQAPRVIRWQQKLLDLSLRNRLLNVRDTKQIIPIACSDITILEDKIAADESLTLNPLYNLLSEKDLHDLSLLRNTDIKNDIRELLDKELNQQRLWTTLSPFEMARRMTNLYRQSKSDLEEGGVNTLFLGIGFLEWKKTERDPNSYLAPILLIPIQLKRKSMSDGIKICKLDEDTVINVTLLELLRQEFNLVIPGIEPLPMDKSGIDVKMILQIFRQTVKDMKGWEVREEVKIGHFSFNKFIMWSDITTRIESLKENPLVEHLIEGGGIFDDKIEVFAPEAIADYMNFDNLYCPVSADSSQLTAVKYSELGKSFVLHGPPGTGKSQTITNIIAHNLALGKRVLFVSEKKAALDVVHKRLSSIGLRPFCLELHSNKSGKSEVLKQFSEALSVANSAMPPDWQNTVQELQSLHNELDQYVKTLHYQYPNKLSAYNCFCTLITHDIETSDHWIKIDCLTHDANQYHATKHLVADLVNAINNTSLSSIKALKSIQISDWNPQLEKQINEDAKKLLEICQSLIPLFQKHAETFGLNPNNHNISNIYNTAVIGQAIKKAKNIPATFLTDTFAHDMKLLLEFSQDSLLLAELQEKLKNYRIELFAELDCEGIEKRLVHNNQCFFIFRLLKNNKLLQELATLKKIGSNKLRIKELIDILPEIAKYNKTNLRIKENSEKVTQLIGNLWNNGKPNWEALKAVFENTQEFISLVNEVSENSQEAKNCCYASLQKLLPDAESQFAENSTKRKEINNYLNMWNKLQSELQNFSKYAPDIDNISNLLTLSKTLQNIISELKNLRNVNFYQKKYAMANELGIANMVADLEQQKFDAADFPKLFDIAYHRTMLNQILITNPILSNFVGNDQNERIKRFCELDHQHLELSRQLVISKLSAALPRRRTGACPEGTELGILKHECEKRARQKPVRQLLELIPTLIQSLKPCFLMSPLSVAQYLPAETAQFDLIIFDEASQIPVWDAIGVIARGKQLIVVGDPKQMPPTNFFQKGESEDAAVFQEDSTDDLESILDECIAAGVHPSYLNWHYRSRHESLIAFSNYHYYDNRLYTFPAAQNSDTLGIYFNFVSNGIYDRKNTRTNQNEAQALVDYIFYRLRNEKLFSKSIGVVTFSQAQKDLIEDLIEKKRAVSPDFEEFFSDQKEESFFVKNLENVQGDERDIILFSICYATDSEGKFSMNFGPLNRQGGERRLNVAITRAKEQIVVFSSIKAEQIDLTRTHATGAMHLKYFLDYAKNGINISSQNIENSNEYCSITNQVANFLNSKNYHVQHNFGKSGCKIDLAVINPEAPDEFIMAIECDGETYAKQKTSRDREHLRSSVLQSLGWHTFRIWSVDWMFDREQTQAKLLAALEVAKKLAPQMPPQKELPQVEEQNILPVVPSAQLTERNNLLYEFYEETSPYPQEYFYELQTRALITQQLLEIINKESPICESLLKRRLVKAWGFSRTGENIQNVLNSCFPSNCQITQIGEERVFWSKLHDAKLYKDYRICGNTAMRRDIDEIPPEEVANAMYEVLTDFHSCEQDVLYRETVKLFGFSAMSNKMRKYLDIAMQVLRESGRI